MVGQIAVEEASYREQLLQRLPHIIGFRLARVGPRIGGCYEESRYEGTTFPRLGRRSHRGRIRRYAGVDRDRVLDRHSLDRNERQHDVHERCEAARLIADAWAS